MNNLDKLQLIKSDLQRLAQIIDRELDDMNREEDMLASHISDALDYCEAAIQSRQRKQSFVRVVETREYTVVVEHTPDEDTYDIEQAAIEHVNCAMVDYDDSHCDVEDIETRDLDAGTASDTEV